MPLRVYPLVFASLVVGLASVSADAQIPKDGILANEVAAVRVAEAILLNIYGDSVLSERPFSAKLEGDYWIITGTLHCSKSSICKGGVARLEISKKDSRVRSVIHEK